MGLLAAFRLFSWTVFFVSLSTGQLTTSFPSVYVTEIYDETTRLVGGDDGSEGLVEVLVNGSWAGVCDENWTIRDAAVVCLSLGFRSPLDTDINDQEGVRKLFIYDVECTGEESSLMQCFHGDIKVGDCNGPSQAAVMCSSSSVRLVGGSGSHEGTVEVFYKSSWGSICENEWDLRDANVVCRSLGFSGADEAFPWSPFGKIDIFGDMHMMHLDNVACSGFEPDLLNCSFDAIPSSMWYYCFNGEMAAARCSTEDYSLMLNGGLSIMDGMVFIFTWHNWGTILGNSLGPNDANVVCRSLGFGNAEGATLEAQPIAGVRSIVWDNPNCTGNEPRIFDCPGMRICNESCNQTESASVQCYGDNMCMAGLCVHGNYSQVPDCYPLVSSCLYDGGGKTWRMLPYKRIL